jgi:hypothetical protein
MMADARTDRDSRSHLRVYGERPGVRPGRASQGRARGADAGPAAPHGGAALI